LGNGRVAGEQQQQQQQSPVVELGDMAHEMMFHMLAQVSSWKQMVITFCNLAATDSGCAQVCPPCTSHGHALCCYVTA
jgi:hypothetical protein